MTRASSCTSFTTIKQIKKLKSARIPPEALMSQSINIKKKSNLGEQKMYVIIGNVILEEIQHLSYQHHLFKEFQ